ncbi:MAG: hypothetical protein IT366_16375 [Candidatus Hydrogenedentes bacterium]|nr:hypothetical protein [Candidatus Hydrogenedentota bacterium]
MTASIVAGLIGIVKAFVTPDNYEAQKILVVTSVDLTAAQSAKGEVSLTSSIQEPLSPKVYADLLSAPNLLGEVYVRLLKEVTITEGDYPNLTSFSNELSASVTIVDQTARPVLYSPIITLLARGHDPEKLRHIVEKWAVTATEWSRTIGEIRTAAAAEQLKIESNRVSLELADLQAAMANERGKWNVEIMRKELEGRQLLMAETEKAQSEAERDLRGSEDTLKAVREAKAGVPEKVQLYRSPSDDAYFILKATGDQKAVADAEKSGMINEFFNPNYSELERLETENLGAVSSSRAKLETAKQQLETLRAKQDEQSVLAAEHEELQNRMMANVKAGLDMYGQIASAERVLNTMQSLATATNENGVTPLGLNQLRKEVSPVITSAFMGQGRKMYVILYVALAFGLSSLYAIFVEVVRPAILHYMRGVQDA